MQIKKPLLAASTIVAAGILASLPLTASARVVCNRAGDCWSTHTDVTYPAELGIQAYSDRYADSAYRDHHWHDNHRNWRDEHHDHDRGYYRDGAWVPM